LNNRLLLYSCAKFNVHFSQPRAPNPPHHSRSAGILPAFFPL
jgi:hypothetical protein